MDNPEFHWGKEFQDYLDSLSKKDAARLAKIINRIQEFGIEDSIRKERVKKLDDSIYEIRAMTNEHWMRGCYFQINQNQYYITHGFSKKTTKTPRKEIVRAKVIRKAFRRKDS